MGEMGGGGRRTREEGNKSGRKWGGYLRNGGKEDEWFITDMGWEAINKRDDVQPCCILGSSL